MVTNVLGMLRSLHIIAMGTGPAANGVWARAQAARSIENCR
jgi:hypothetical protein